MTREQIEKAATESCVIDNSIFNPEYVPYYEHGFMDGAEWRINSVWHKPSENVESLIKEIPVVVKLKRNYLLLGKFEEFLLYDGDRDSDGNYSYTMSCYFLSTSLIEYALSDVLEYAYLDDLLPERKEETE